MLTKFTDDMETVTSGDLIYSFYRKVIANKDTDKFPEIPSFKLHDIINHVTLHPDFVTSINKYLKK